MELFTLTEKSEIIVQKLKFDFNGIRYEGSGYLKWDPADGFILETSVKPKNRIGFRAISIGGGGPIPKNSIKFEINHIWNAISPNVFLSSFDEIGMIQNGRLVTEFSNLILFSKGILTSDSKSGCGKSVYLVKKNTVLSDYVNHNISIEGKVLTDNSARDGIIYRDDDISLTGYVNVHKHLEISWEFLNNKYSKFHDWQMAMVIRDALSISLGQVVRILKRQISRGRKTIIEIIKPESPFNLGYFAPITNNGYLDKALLGKLIKLFLTNDKNAIICRNLFYRIADALQVKNMQVWEFMISSALEAVLRTYESKPFLKRKKGWSIENSLEKFRQRYFIQSFKQEWIEVFKKAKNAHKILRHQNAHPYWPTMEMGEIVSAKYNESYDYMVYLSKFYGYIILALAGYKDLKPDI